MKIPSYIIPLIDGSYAVVSPKISPRRDARAADLRNAIFLADVEIRRPGFLKHEPYKFSDVALSRDADGKYSVNVDAGGIVFVRALVLRAMTEAYRREEASV